jgi:hypothetical protein
MSAFGNRRTGATPGLARRSFGWVCSKTGRLCMRMQMMFRRPLFRTERNYPQRLLKTRFRSHPANQSLEIVFATARPDRGDRHCTECTAAIVRPERRSSMVQERQDGLSTSFDGPHARQRCEQENIPNLCSSMILRRRQVSNLGSCCRAADRIRISHVLSIAKIGAFRLQGTWEIVSFEILVILVVSYPMRGFRDSLL